MADISKITLPTGTTYDVKDSTARQAIENITSFEYIICTNAANTPKDVTWDSGGTTITGTLDPSEDTKGKMYLVPSTNGTKDIYNEYITVNTTGTTYVWELFGNTDVHIGDLGDLAFKNSASGSFTPSGSVTLNSSEKFVADSATGGGSVNAGSAASCTLPSLSTSVSNETLVLTWSAGSFTANVPTAVTLPSFSSQNIPTSASFNGSSGTVSVS